MLSRTSIEGRKSVCRLKGSGLKRRVSFDILSFNVVLNEPLKKFSSSGFGAFNSSSMATIESQNSKMLSREQLLHLFDRFSVLVAQPDVKKRISDAVKDNQEAVAITTAIQEEIFVEMGLDPRFGIACLGKVNMVYENDRDLMINFYGFVAKEEMACDEAELEPDEFAERMHMQDKLHEQQLEMLRHMRKFRLDEQSVMLQKLRQQMEKADFNTGASILSVEQIENIGKRRVTPVFQPR